MGFLRVSSDAGEGVTVGHRFVAGHRLGRAPAVLGGVSLFLLLVVAACTADPALTPSFVRSAGSYAAFGLSVGIPASGSASAGVSGRAGGSASTPGAGVGGLAGLGVQPADFPAGWVAAPYRPVTAQEGANASFASCLGARDIIADRLAVGYSEAFSMGSAQVHSEVGRYRSGPDMSGDRAALGNPKFGSCLREMLVPEIARSLPAGAVLGGVSIAVSPGPGADGPGNEYGSYTVRVSVVRAGVTLTFFSTTVLIWGPLQLLAQIDFNDLGHPVARALQARLVQVVAARVGRG